MKINQVEFIISAVQPSQYPKDGLPEIALAGRSNVGKSSLINKLCNRKNIARTSQKPGKTQTLNYYKINDKFYFVDVPGYGYAKVSKKEKQAWGRMLETYFTTNKQLKAVIQIVDLRHPPSNDDQQMYEFLKYYEIPTIIVATKADKIPKGKLQKHQKIVKEVLNIEPNDPITLFSAHSGFGKDELWRTISQYL
ncbi:GTP-binding protein [Scopulibacillus daqui]|uniref:Probable GTP-binding protein EngB n=1 Tax=Scopulibacillus daqui TaxID=1469162 RepID=A0ABS2PZN6_9BACL|nr:ribosome biogenesis GTP-binding protein YihA/YsxC [Scopulibacillus daqui]MBM7644737.1 GTP-binding protein [Scopulibacillus daqui]